MMTALEDMFEAGDELENQQNWIGAIEIYTEALEVEESPKVHAKIGFCHFMNDDLDKAISSFDQALLMKPGAARTLYFRGRAKERNHELDSALEDYRESIRIKPNQEDAREDIALLLKYKKKVHD